jgi:hypothetical protein
VELEAALPAGHQRADHALHGARRLCAQPARRRDHPARRAVPRARAGLSLSSRCPLEIVDGRDARARIELGAGETASFVLERAEAPVPFADADIAAELDATVAFWRRWLGRSTYAGRWRETSSPASSSG